MTHLDKARINRARRAAERQGMRLIKSTRRDPRALDYDRFWLNDAHRDTEVAGGANGLTIDAIEDYLDRPLRKE